MKQTKIDALTSKRDQLNAQIQAIRAKEQSQKRKDDTRRKVLIGSVMLKLIKSGEMEADKLTALLDRHLDSERDRQLFGLASRNAVETLSPPEPPADGTPASA